MKKFTLILIATLFAFVGFAQKPLANAEVFAKTTNAVVQNAGKVNVPRTFSSSSKKKAQQKSEDDYVVITEQPKGELKTYARSGGHYYVSSGSLYYGDQSGTIDIVWGEEGKVYFKDIVSGLAYDTWVEGTLGKDGATITVALDQNLRYVSTYDACIALKMLKYDSGFSVVEDVTEVTFTIDDAGVISLQGTGFSDKSLGGIWTDDGTIQNYGDYESVYTPYEANLTLVTLPEGLTAVDMPMTGIFFPDVYSDGEDFTATVKVAKDGNTFYIQGLAQAKPEAWVKGEYDEGKGEIVIPVTYLGENETGHVYAMGYSSTGPVPIYLTYDEGNGAMGLDGYLMLTPTEITLDVNNLYCYYQALFIGEKPTLVEVPDGLEIVETPFTATTYDGSTSSGISGTVNIAINDETGDVYIQGLIQETPQGWIKGSFSEDGTEVVFPYGQYVGESEYGLIYAVGDKEIENENQISDIVFSYNAIKNTFESQNVIYSSLKKNAIYYTSAIFNIVIGTDCDVIWVAAEQGYQNTEEITEFVIAADEEKNALITGLAAQAEGIIPPKYFTSGKALRMFAGNTLTIASVMPISKIKFTSGNSTSPYFDVSTGEYEVDDGTGIWTGEANEIVFSVPIDGQQNRIQKIEIWYFDASTTIVEAPEDLVTVPYLFKANDTYYNEEVTKDIQVGFYGENTVYIQGLSGYITDAWVKGTLKNGIVTIPATALGAYESWFGSYELIFSGASFVYDAETETFTSVDGFTSNDEDDYAWDEYNNVVLTKLNDVAATPADPEITKITTVNVTYPKVNFTIATVDVNGKDLITDKLYYQLFIEKNGEVTPLVLEKDLYKYLEENMSEIPYNFTDDYDIYNNMLYLNQDVNEIYSWDKIGIQSIYYGGGECNKSNIVWKYNIAPVTVSDALYATYVAPADVDFTDSGVSAFAVTVNGEYAHLEPVTTVPAGTVVVVKAAKAGSYGVPKTTGATLGTTNELVAATTNITADGTQYVLAKVNDVIGFYQAIAGSTIAAGKGYLVVSSSVKSFYGFDEDATAISDIVADENAVIYNLAGQRVNKTVKGINIINGKKILK